MPWNVLATAATIARAATEDLLDRATVYRAGMEPAALALIDAELAARGLSASDVEEHGRERAQNALYADDGAAVRCDFCDRPAVTREPGWHRLWGRVPVFPRMFACCAEHAKARGAEREAGS